jgi:F420H(2)-dependent quinone reductase
MALAHRRPDGMYRWVANAPRWFYRLGLGWVLGHRMVQLTHRGRKSGQFRRTILEVLHYDPRAHEVQVVSGWEGKTDWYRNIEREPARGACEQVAWPIDPSRSFSRPRKRPN